MRKFGRVPALARLECNVAGRPRVSRGLRKPQGAGGTGILSLSLGQSGRHRDAPSARVATSEDVLCALPDNGKEYDPGRPALALYNLRSPRRNGDLAGALECWKWCGDHRFEPDADRLHERMLV